MKKTAPLEAILFDPLSWLHPRCLPLSQGFANVRSRSIVNDMIIRAQGWTTDCPRHDVNIPAQEFIRHWRRLPQVALIMACQRHRARLALQGQWLGLPAWVRQFSELSLVEPFNGTGAPLKLPDDLYSWGERELLAFSDRLPIALSQRISLLFPPDMDREAAAGFMPAPSALLLRLATQHAERNSITPDAADFRWGSDQTCAAAAPAPGA